MEALNCLHNRRFRIGIQRTRCLIKYQNLRIMIQRPRNTKTLSLTAGETHTPLPDLHIQHTRQLLYKILQLGFFQHMPYALIIDILFCHTERYIFTDRIIRQINGLRNVTDMGQPGWIIFKNISSIA